MGVTEIRIARSPLIWRLLCTSLTLFILWLALVPVASAPSGLGWDKLNHAGAIAVVTALAYFAFQSYRKAATTAFLYGTSLGILIEILQATMTTTRSAEWSDVVADIVGAGFAWIIIRMYQRRTALKR